MDDEIVHLKNRLESLKSLQIENEFTNNGLLSEIDQLKSRLAILEKELVVSKSNFSDVLEKNLFLEAK